MIKFLTERINVGRGHAIVVALLAASYGVICALKMPGSSLVTWYIVGTAVWSGVSVAMFYRRPSQG